MKILVLGAGALGGYYGARLLEAGAEVTFLVRQHRAAQLQEGGLVVQSPLGNVARPVHTVAREQVTPDYDLVLLTCKTYDLDHAITAMAPAVGERTGILPLLNGVATYDILDQHFGTGRVLGGVAYIATMLAPSGHIRHLSPGDTLLIGPRAEATKALAASFYEVVSHTPGTRLLSGEVGHDCGGSGDDVCDARAHWHHPHDAGRTWAHDPSDGRMRRGSQAVRTRTQAGGGAHHAWHLARRGLPMGRVDDA